MLILGLISLMTLAAIVQPASDALEPSPPQIYACPDNTVYYNLKPCDPMEPSQCPRGFACRLSRLVQEGKPTDRFSHLCCDSSKMNIADWLVALQLSPQVIPRPPSTTVESVILSSFDYNVPPPEVHMNDQLDALNYSNYVIASVQALKLGVSAPPARGFLHILLFVDGARSQCAIFLNYDIPSEGKNEVTVNISDSNGQRFYGAVSGYSIRKQSTNRHQYVLLVYHTNQKLSSMANVTEDISKYLQKIPYFLTSSSTGRALGQPIAGTFFYIISRRSMFGVDGIPVSPKPSGGPHVLTPHNFTFFICFITWLLYYNLL